MLLTLYLIALAIGGTMVLASLAFGGDSDADVDADVDADIGADADADADSGGHDWGDGFDAWLPLMSMRFWTFFLAFFGLTGSLLSGLDLAGTIPSAVAAVGVGYASGLACVRVIRSLQSEVVDSSVSTDDLVGAGGRVIVPVGPGKTGKVRIEIKGRSVELLADTEETTALAAGQTVLVYAVQDDGRVLVSRNEQLDA